MRSIKVSTCLGRSFALIAALAFAFTPVRAQTPSGPSVSVRMTDAVDSGTDPGGKQYRASLTKAVDAGNGVVFPQGAAATVSLVNSGNGWTTHLISVSVNGQPVAVTSSPASVTSAAQSAAGSAVNSVNSVLGGFGRHVNTANAAATAVATGQRAILPPGTTLSFVLTQPLAANAPSPAATTATTASVPTAAPSPGPAAGSTLVAAPGQDWYMCRFLDQNDPANAALGSRMYYAVLPVSKAQQEQLTNHFIAYVEQNYKVAKDGSPSSRLCRRIANDAAGRTYSMDQFQKQWTSSNIQGIPIQWANTGQAVASPVAPAPVSNGKECEYHGTCTRPSATASGVPQR